MIVLGGEHEDAATATIHDFDLGCVASFVVLLLCVALVLVDGKVFTSSHVLASK
jgi:hypothetical protein